MQQLELKPTEKPGLSALSDDAKAAGDLKDVAALVFPEAAQEDPEKARNELSNGLNQNHRRTLDIDKAIEIIVAAVAKTKRSSLLEYIISRLPNDSCDFRWLTREDKIERVVASMSEVLPAFNDIVQRVQSLLDEGRK